MDENQNGMTRLLGIMAQLRDPERGCPWDLQQDFSTIAPYTIEDTRDLQAMGGYAGVAHMDILRDT